jgi:hypothetical protein
MKASQAIAAGLRAAWGAKWLVFLFFAANLVLAAALAAPMHSAIRDHLGNSAVGEELARGFSATWLLEFQLVYGAFLKGFSTALVYGGIVFLLLNTVLSAGAFEVFTRGEGARMHAFGRGVGKYAFRFFRLMVIASALYFVVFWFWNSAVGWLVENWADDLVRERWYVMVEWLRWALLAFSVFTVSAVTEYAKASIVAHDRASVLAALGDAAGFVLAHFRRVMATYVGLGALGALTIFLYATFARFFPQSSVLTVFLWFMVAQAFLWLRWMFRLASWAAAVGYYGADRRVTAAPVSVPAAAD